jgi:hypothetical protein
LIIKSFSSQTLREDGMTQEATRSLSDQDDVVVVKVLHENR